jgi:hypothetical protein
MQPHRIILVGAGMTSTVGDFVNLKSLKKWNKLNKNKIK